MPPTPQARRKPPSGSQAPKKNNRRLYIGLAIAGLAIVAYLWYRNYSSNAQTSSAFTPSSGATQPAATDSGGGGSTGTPTPTDDLSGILSSLAGENQSLLSAFLGSEQGFASLAGSSLGAPTANTGTSSFTAPVATVAAPPAQFGAASTPQGSQPSGPTPAAEAQSASTPSFQQTLTGNLVSSGPPVYYTPPASSYQPAPNVQTAAAETASIAANPIMVNTGLTSSTPQPVKVAANPSGATKTKSQGIISIH